MVTNDRRELKVLLGMVAPYHCLNHFFPTNSTIGLKNFSRGSHQFKAQKYRYLNCHSIDWKYVEFLMSYCKTTAVLGYLVWKKHVSSYLLYWKQSVNFVSIFCMFQWYTGRFCFISVLLNGFVGKWTIPRYCSYMSIIFDMHLTIHLSRVQFDNRSKVVYENTV